MTVHDLPAINAALNGTSAILLLVARNRIKHKAVRQHRALMITAFATSILFLICYLIYHYEVGIIHFGGTGLSRPFYFTLLTSHTILAAAVPILATLTLIRGLRARYNKHVKIAKWTYPVWLYVSATGVIIYFMLYQLFPQAM
jgi:protein SCO1/2/putative membrane protein